MDQSSTNQSTADTLSQTGKSVLNQLSHLFDLTKKFLNNPVETWTEIKSADQDVPTLIKQIGLYVVCLPALCTFIGLWIVGYDIPMVGTVRYSFGEAFQNQIVNVIVGLIMLFVSATIIEKVSGRFSGGLTKSSSLALLIYSMLPGMWAGVLGVWPGMLSGMLALAAGIFGLTLFARGATILGTVKEEERWKFTGCSILFTFLAAIVISLCLSIFKPTIAEPDFNINLPDGNKISSQDLEDFAKKYGQEVK